VESVDGADGGEVELVYVARDEIGPATVLTAAQRAVLEAWSGRLIPADTNWPSAPDVGTPAYVEAVMARSDGTRDAVLRALAAIEATARETFGSGFVTCDAGQQDQVLDALRSTPVGPTCEAVLTFTYEDYYRSPRVVAVLLDRTGFDSTLPHLGSAMDPFDDTLLDRVRTLPPHYRQVP
jgi:hypothetical protein